MVKLTKKSKIALAAVAVLAVVLVIAVPFASAQAAADNAVGNIKTLNAKGYAVLQGDTADKLPANFSLTLQAASAAGAAKRFDVTGGTIIVNGEAYAVTGGNGGVAAGRHLILLQAQGTGSDGQSVTFKLEGRYFWLGGHLYVARVAAKLQTEGGNYTLLMKAAIRV